MSFAMDATVCKNKIIMKTSFRDTPTSLEKPLIHGLRGFKVHVFNPIWFIIFTDFSSPKVALHVQLAKARGDLRTEAQ